MRQKRLAVQSKRQAAFRWLGDEAEAQRLQQEQTYHYVRWTFLVVLGAVIAGLIAVGLALLRCSNDSADVCFWHKTDIRRVPVDVRFWG